MPLAEPTLAGFISTSARNSLRLGHPRRARLTWQAGPGRVWLQTMPLPVLAHALTPYLPTTS